MSNSDQELVSKRYHYLLNNCDFYEDEAKNNDNDSVSLHCHCCKFFKKASFFEKLKTYASSGEIVEYKGTNEPVVRINIGATCLLKEIGDKVLDNQLVKDNYQEIKLHITKKTEQEDGDQGTNEPVGRINIGATCLLKEIGDKALDDKLVKDKYQEIKLPNKKTEQEDGDETKMTDLQRVENRDKTRRKKTEYIRADDIGPGLHLARIKVNMALDKGVAFHALYHPKEGLRVSGTSINFETQKNEKLTIYKSGKIAHRVECSEKKFCISYEELGPMWQDWFDKNNAYSVTEIKTILKIFLRGDDGMYDWFENNEIWRFVIELILGVEIKRSSHAILTNPMFFELVNKGKYKLGDLQNKLPSAMKHFVEASCNVDTIMNKTMFDFRDKDKAASETVPKVDDKVKELAERDKNILKDWLVEVKGAISDITDRTEIIKIKPKYFYDLIDEWYAIEIDDLNKDEELKWHFSVTNVYSGVCKESCSQ